MIYVPNSRPWIYVMGPYASSGHVLRNTRRAIEAGELVMEMGGFPIVPHNNTAWELLYPHDWNFWQGYNMYLLDRCDAAYRIRGHSPGSVVEEESCIFSRNIRVFFEGHPNGELALFHWITQWLEEHDPSARHPDFRRSRKALLAHLRVLGGWDCVEDRHGGSAE